MAVYKIYRTQSNLENRVGRPKSNNTPLLSGITVEMFENYKRNKTYKIQISK